MDREFVPAKARKTVLIRRHQVRFYEVIIGPFRIIFLIFVYIHPIAVVTRGCISSFQQSFQGFLYLENSTEKSFLLSSLLLSLPFGKIPFTGY